MGAIIVFSGPSLSATDRAKSTAIVFHGPAAFGDVARAAASGASAIGLIDGVFETTLSPWHKELLWAMSLGVSLFGAASMGALRAAELAHFGMTGVGEVFAAYRDGRLTDDDEVAVLHAPAELGYAPLTVPMVNVRWTLQAATESGAISRVCASLVVAAAKRIFYKDRTWDAVWLEAGRAGVECEPIKAWFTRVGSIDIKRRDGQQLLRLLAGAPLPIAREHRPFTTTVYWERARRRIEQIGVALPVDS